MLIKYVAEAKRASSQRTSTSVLYRMKPAMSRYLIVRRRNIIWLVLCRQCRIRPPSAVAIGIAGVHQGNDSVTLCIALASQLLKLKISAAARCGIRCHDMSDVSHPVYFVICKSLHVRSKRIPVRIIQHCIHINVPQLGLSRACRWKTCMSLVSPESFMR